MPRYFFVVQRANMQEDDFHGTVLPNDSAALHHAEHAIAKLHKEEGYSELAGFIIVKNERNELIFSVPFLAACA